MDLSPLDNPVWHSIASRHVDLSSGNAQAASYHNAVSPFAALAPDAELDALASVIEPGEVVLLALADALARQARPGWEELARVPCLQMICDEADRVDDDGHITELGDRHAQQMLELAELTEPGPFAIETHRFGGYFGVQDQDRLMAMAGERFSMPGWVEVSGVCTHPDARGKGYAAQLVRRVIRSIHGRGDRAFLHVRVGSPSERTAVGVYERLGFRHHQIMTVQVMRRSV